MQQAWLVHWCEQLLHNMTNHALDLQHLRKALSVPCCEQLLHQCLGSWVLGGGTSTLLPGAPIFVLGFIVSTSCTQWTFASFQH
jgi:hypothetical protein